MKHSGESRIREEICEAGRRLYARHIIVATDGNISARLDDGTFLVTPAGVCKGELAPEDLVKVDLEGRVQGKGRATTELRMHLACFRERSDVAAVVHGHPPHVVAHLIAGKSLAHCLIPEVIIHLGLPQVARYGMPSSQGLADSIRALIRENDCVLMDHHGALTVGPDVMDAYYKMEKLEHAALIVAMARLMGGIRELPPNDVNDLLIARAAGGVPGRVNVSCELPCVGCKATCNLRGAAGVEWGRSS